MLSLNMLYFITLSGLFNLFLVDAVTIRQFFGSLSNYTEVNLTDPSPLIQSPFYNASRGNVFYTFGLGKSPDTVDSQTIGETYITLDEFNYFLLNWQKEASAPSNLILNSLAYVFYAAPNAIIVGDEFGDALIKLDKIGFDLSNTHLVGHSLGAQLMGRSAERVQTMAGKNVSHVTGLDPAGPFFEGILSLPKLKSDCASFVEVIHTNPGYLGTTDNLGMVDIWFNFVNGSQPGCTNSSLTSRQQASCSHQRAWMYYSEGVLNSNALAAVTDSSYNSWKARTVVSNTSVIVHIDNDVITGARGNAYLSTNSAPPYGLGNKGLVYIY